MATVIRKGQKLKDWLEAFKSKLHLKSPTIYNPRNETYITGTGMNKERCEPKLEMTFAQLLEAGDFKEGDEFEMSDFNY